MRPLPPERSRSVTSPCTGLCKRDAGTGWCLGCGRSGAEMDGWGIRSDAARTAIWDAIPDRLRQLGVACRRLPWTEQDIRGFVITTAKNGQGTWVMGDVGAQAAFAPTRDTQVRKDGDAVIARTPNGTLRMVINENTRALSCEAPGLLGVARIVLAVKRTRHRPPGTSGGAERVDPIGTQLIETALGHIAMHGGKRHQALPAADTDLPRAYLPGAIYYPHT